jgi:hypothetical protein
MRGFSAARSKEKWRSRKSTKGEDGTRTSTKGLITALRILSRGGCITEALLVWSIRYSADQSASARLKPLISGLPARIAASASDILRGQR